MYNIYIYIQGYEALKGETPRSQGRLKKVIDNDRIFSQSSSSFSGQSSEKRLRSLKRKKEDLIGGNMSTPGGQVKKKN